jgi:RNA polymerase sigma-70 factor (ECF subfamily)
MPNGTPTDEELIDRARGGDQAAFRVLVERYEGKVAATVVGMLGPGADAEDVGQETFIRLYRALATFRGESSLGTYVTRIAINQSLKALKRRRTWASRFLSRDDAEREIIEPVEPAGAELDERERSMQVERALATLPPEQRAIVVLRVMEGFSTKETAEVLGVPQGTVMSRLSRALQKLEPRLAGMKS